MRAWVVWDFFLSYQISSFSLSLGNGSLWTEIQFQKAANISLSTPSTPPHPTKKNLNFPVWYMFSSHGVTISPVVCTSKGKNIENIECFRYFCLYLWKLIYKVQNIRRRRFFDLDNSLMKPLTPNQRNIKLINYFKVFIGCGV